MTTNVRLRGSTWYLRVSVPSDLQIIVGKKEIWRSLRTGEHKEARRLAVLMQEALHREWDTLRKTRELAAADIEHAIWDRYVEMIEADDRFRLALPTDEDLDEIWTHLDGEFGEHSVEALRIFETIRDSFDHERKARADRLLVLRQHAARGEIRSVADVMKSLLAKRGLQVSNSADHKKLAHGLLRAELEAHLRFSERDEGDFTGAPSDKLVRPPKLAREPVVPAGETIMGLFDRYQREMPASVSRDTWDQNRKIVGLFADFAGSKAHVSVITRKTVRDWKAKLFEWPVKAAEIRAFRGMGFQAVIDANKTIKKPTLSEKTINKYLSGLGSFCKYLKGSGFIDDDVMGLYLKLDRSRKVVLPYDDNQLGTLFASPLFHSCGGNKREHEQGDIQFRDWRYWLPLIALYTGARLGEIAQLLIKDVRKIQGHWCFHVCKEGERQKSVKTGGSERVVPMHPELIRLGLPAYHARMEEAGRIGLFPEIKPDARGFMSGGPSKFYQHYFRAIGIKVDKSVNCHSLRHGIADAFRRGGFLDEQFGMLLGHVKATTTQRYGIVSEGILASRIAMINSVSFPSVEAALKS